MPTMLTKMITKMVRAHPKLTTLAVACVGLIAVVAYELWQLSGKVAEYRQYWATPRGAPGGLRYVALGDSAAQGIGASTPQHGYVSLIAERLRQLTGRPVEIINISRSGARLRGVVRNQLPRLGELHADFITVEVGGNDIGSWDAAEFTRDAVALCSGVPPDKTVIATVPDFMHGKWQARSLEATQVLRRACTRRGVAVAALYTAIKARGWWGMFTRKLHKN